MESKICKTCSRDLPIDEFYFKDKNKTYRHASCKSCKREYEKNRRNNFEQVNAKSGGSRTAITKVCNSCRKEKNRTSFYEHTDSRRKGILSAKCKSCIIEASEERRRNFSADKKFSEVLRHRVYRKENAHICNEYLRRKRVKQKQAIPIFSNKSKIQEIYKQASILGLSVDHIIPLNSKYVSGLHTEHNLQLLSLQENTIKNNRYWPDMPIIDTELKQLAERFYNHV